MSMKMINIPKSLLLILLLWGGLGSWCLAEQSSLEQVTAPAVDVLQSKLEAVKTMDVLSEDQRKQAESLYTQAIENLNLTSDYQKREQQYIDIINSASERRAKLQESLEQVQQAMKPTEKGYQLGANGQPLGEAELEQQLLKKQAELLKLRGKQGELNARNLSSQQNVSKLLEAALLDQNNARTETESLPDDAPVEIENAYRVLQLSKMSAADAQVEMLNERLLSRDVRLELLEMEQQLLNYQLVLSARHVSALQNALNETRRQQALEREKQAQEKLERLSATDPYIKELAGENARLAEEITRITHRTDALLEKLAEIRRQRSRVDRYYSSMTQQLAVAGADRLEVLSIDLLAQRKEFADNAKPVIQIKNLDQELTRAQLNQLRLEDRQHILDDTFNPKGESEINVQYQQEYDDLKIEQRSLVQETIKAYRHYADTLTTTLTEKQALDDKIEEYQKLLTSRLFWIPSTLPLDRNFPAQLNQEIASLLGGAAPADFESEPAAINFHTAIVALLLILLALLLVSTRRRLLAHLKTTGINVGKVYRDHASNTFLALLISFALALPIPLVLAAIGICLREKGGLSSLIGLGLLPAAGLWLILTLFYQILRKQGLAEAHFRLRADSLALVRKNLPWVTLVLCVTLTLMPAAQYAAQSYEALSRVIFTVAVLSLMLVAHRILKPRGKLYASDAKVKVGQDRLWRYGLYSLVILVPLLLIALSWLGYHYSAMQIQIRIFNTACLIGILVLFYSLIVRAASVSERRITLEHLKAKRKAEKVLMANRQAADDAAEGIPDVIELPEFNLEQVSRQTRGFIGVSLAAVGIFLLWQLWKDLLPAINVLNDIQLWSVSTSDPNDPVITITLADVLLALVMLFLTYYGTRNIPGILEISLLQRMDLGPGGSYAVVTIVKYLIVLIGLVTALNLIGIQWSKLQWLIAALGVGLGFGLQEIVANFVSGLLILFERPIRVGDTVTVGAHTGTVTRIRIRATTLTDWDRKEQIIPNKTFITEQLTNWTLSDPITRQIIKVGVAYGSNVEHVHRILTKVIEDNSRIVSDPPPAVFFVGFGDSSLNFELRVFVPGMLDIMPLVHELHVALESELRKEGIEIPFPQRDVWIRTAENSGNVPP